MAEQTVELYVEREMPTAGGSEDPADFITTGVINGIPPALYYGMSYLYPEAMEVDGSLVTARIKIDERTVKPISFLLRIQDTAAEFWSVTPEGLYYDIPLGEWQTNFNMLGDLGVWSCVVERTDEGVNTILASGPQVVGGFTIPAGSVAVDLGSNGGVAFLELPDFTVNAAVDNLTIDFDYFTFEDPHDTGNESRLDLAWAKGVFGEPDYEGGSEIFELEDCEVGENSFFLDTIPIGARIRLFFVYLGSADGRLVASMSAIKLTSI